MVEIMKWRLAATVLSAGLLVACGSQAGNVATASPSAFASPSASETSAEAATGGGRYGSHASAQPSATAPSAAAGAGLVQAVNFSFQPPTQTVTVGSSVTFRNADSVTHTFTANGGAFDSGNVSPGGSFTFKFSTAGTFAFHCRIHASMTGTITVSA